MRERIEMRDKSHRSTKKIVVESREEPKVSIPEPPPVVNPTKEGYLVVVVSYLENNAQIGISHTEATIRRIDEAEFRDEISKCRGSKPATFSVINKYSPINRENRSTGNISIGHLTGSSWTLGVPGPLGVPGTSGSSGADGDPLKDAFTW
jgi:hypothetical protein